MGTTPECGGSVAALAAMPDNKRFFSGGYDSIIRVWLLDGTLKSAFAEVHPGHIININININIKDRHDTCLCGGAPWPHRIYKRACPRGATRQPAHALSGSADTTVKLFCVDDGAVLRTFRHHTPPTKSWSPVTSLALLPDGRRFVSGSVDMTTCIVEHGLAP